eukprot:397149-Rhodomonas_salina.2
MCIRDSPTPPPSTSSPPHSSPSPVTPPPCCCSSRISRVLIPGMLLPGTVELDFSSNPAPPQPSVEVTAVLSALRLKYFALSPKVSAGSRNTPSNFTLGLKRAVWLTFGAVHFRTRTRWRGKKEGEKVRWCAVCYSDDRATPFAVAGLGDVRACLSSSRDDAFWIVT